MIGYAELRAHELNRGEGIAWVLRWIIYGIATTLAVVVFLLGNRTFALLGLGLGLFGLGYNTLISRQVKERRAAPWVRFASVTLDILTLTLYNLGEGLTFSPYAPISTATLLIYPIIILVASMRLDRGLIIYATFLSALSMNVVYLACLPRMDQAILEAISSGDTAGQVYRSLYVILSGLALYFVPVTMERLLRKQSVLLERNRDFREKAHTDKLTGLANRRELDDVLTRVLAGAGGSGGGVGIIFIDLDSFKAVNDSRGHEMGDLVLTEIGRRLVLALRDTDLVARVGGDEFVAIVGSGSHRPGLDHLASRILEAVGQPIDLPGGPARVGASIGISRFPADGMEAEDLIRQADKAMYEAKHRGKNTWRFASD